MIDCDDMDRPEVIQLAQKLMSKFDLWGYSIRQSSPNHFHIIFDRPVTWQRNVQVLAHAVILTCYNKNVVKYVIMQYRKGTCSLRVTIKNSKKPAPFEVLNEGSQNHAIWEFDQYRDEFINDGRCIVQSAIQPCAIQASAQSLCKTQQMEGVGDEQVSIICNDMSLPEVTRFAQKLSEKFDLWHYSIKPHNTNQHRIVFDRTVTFKENVQIMAQAVIRTGFNENMLKYVIQKCIEEQPNLPIEQRAMQEAIPQ